MIVDEAHHYPAHTWSRIVEHFRNTRIIFLTATPRHNGQYILQDKQPCYELLRQDAVDQGYIRPLLFDPVGNAGDSLKRQEEILLVLERMQVVLLQHDNDDQEYRHKGMILASSIEEANTIVQLWNAGQHPAGICARYTQGDPAQVVSEFIRPDGDTRVLVVIRRLTEGFDCKHV